MKVFPHARVIDPEMLSRAIRTAKAFYPVVIVDMHQGLTPQLMVAKDFATHLLILTTASERRIPSTAQLLDEVKTVQHAAKLRVIVNRVQDDEEVRRVRAALEDYKTPILTLPFQAGLLVDDDPEFVPITGSKGKDPYPAAFRKMAVRALDWEAPKTEGPVDPDEPKPSKGSVKGRSRKQASLQRSLAAPRRVRPRRKGRSADAQVRQANEGQDAPRNRVDRRACGPWASVGVCHRPCRIPQGADGDGVRGRA